MFKSITIVLNLVASSARGAVNALALVPAAASANVQPDGTVLMIEELALEHAALNVFTSVVPVRIAVMSANTLA
jgi:hypothetical protein